MDDESEKQTTSVYHDHEEKKIAMWNEKFYFNVSHDFMYSTIEFQVFADRGKHQYLIGTIQYPVKKTFHTSGGILFNSPVESSIEIKQEGKSERGARHLYHRV